MDDCIFCKIIKDELPSSKIYEDENHIAILDLFPVTKGHTLLIPKRHHVNVFDCDDELGKETYPKLKILAKAIKEATGCNGLNIVQNNGAEAGQMVFHSHIHIIPRYPNDGIPIGAAGKNQASSEELLSMAQKIREHLGK